MATKSNREHSFDFELAGIVGVEKAILLKNFRHWVEDNQRNKRKPYLHHDKYWTSESLGSLAAKYPYMQRTTIGRWVNELAESGWLTILKAEGEVNFYRPGQVFDLWEVDQNWQGLLKKIAFQLEAKGDEKAVKRVALMLSQNGTVPVSKWDGACLKMGRTNIEGYIEENIEGGNTPNGGSTPSKPKKEKALDPLDKRQTWIPERDRLEAEGVAAKADGKSEQELTAIRRKYQTINTMIAVEDKIDAAIELLNTQTGTKYPTTTPATRKVIRTRLKEHTFADVEMVVRFKAKAWKDDAKMREYLRPSTLFNGHFLEYLEAAKLDQQKPITAPKTPAQIYTPPARMLK
jgi:uncharacterized phage protein (TIGR02220 family)